MKPFALALLAALAVSHADAQTGTVVPDPALRAELAGMYAADQEVRLRILAAGVPARMGTAGLAPADSVLLAEMAATDAAHTVRFQQIVKTCGWPSAALAGADGANAAFFVVQHAVPAVQEEMLPLVEAVYRNGDLPGPSYALLIDRVLVNRGEPQVYGTQATRVDQWVNGEPSVGPTIRDATLDARRAEVGLPPLDVYLRMLKQVYAAPAASGQQMCRTRVPRS